MHYFLFSLLLFYGADTPSKASEQEKPFLGVKFYPAQAGEMNHSEILKNLHYLGFNSLFCSVYDGQTAFYPSKIFTEIDTTFRLHIFRKELAVKAIEFGAICPIFFDPLTVDQRPDLIPTDQYGHNHYDNWQKMVCPSDENYKQYKLLVIREIVKELSPEIISLDFIRFPVTWELINPNTPADSIRQFCFCQRCLNHFYAQTKLQQPKNLLSTRQIADWILSQHKGTWTDWKVSLITDFIIAVREVINECDPQIRLAVHLVPWSSIDIQGESTTITGQSIDQLQFFVDIFSPMIYHKLIGKPKHFIAELSAEIKKRSSRTVVPSIQFDQIINEGPIDTLEFTEMIKMTRSDSSDGFVIFNWHYLFETDQRDSSNLQWKLQILRKFNHRIEKR